MEIRLLKLTEMPAMRYWLVPGTAQSTNQTVLIPQDWFDTLLEYDGEGSVRTFVKSLLYKG